MCVSVATAEPVQTPDGIINLSWNIKDPSNAIAYAIKKAYTDGRSGLGCVVVGSSGNWYDYGNGLTGVSFPASMDEVIAVGAINNNGSGWYYSQRGSLLELVAPSGVGVNVAGQAIGDVVTLDRMGTMGYHTYNFTGNFGGTSVSCALVSGVAALVLSKAPELTVAEVRSILQTSASDLGPIGFDNTFGYGLVNAYEAVRQASSMHLQKVGGGSVMSSSKQSLDLKPVGINTFRIDLPNEASVSTGMWKVTVSDIATGCCVYTETTDGSAGCLIDGSIWKSGIYVVDASSETGHVTGKLSIRR